MRNAVNELHTLGFSLAFGLSLEFHIFVGVGLLTCLHYGAQLNSPMSLAYHVLKTPQMTTARTVGMLMEHLLQC